MIKSEIDNIEVLKNKINSSKSKVNDDVFVNVKHNNNCYRNHKQV